MTITAAFPTQSKADALAALCPPGNTYKIALYPSTANIDATATTYSATGEVTGTGYTAGGATLTGYSATIDTTTACLTFANPTWSNSTITARGAVIYDATNGNKVRAVLNFGADVTSTNGTFTVTMPAATAAAAVIRIA